MRHPSKLPNSLGTLTDLYLRSNNDAQRDMGAYVQQHLKDTKTFGYVKPYIPVIQGPVVKKVWIPDHPSSTDISMLVGGHWVYLMIEGPKWFVEQRQNTE